MKYAQGPMVVPVAYGCVPKSRNPCNLQVGSYVGTPLTDRKGGTGAYGIAYGNQ